MKEKERKWKIDWKIVGNKKERNRGRVKGEKVKTKWNKKQTNFDTLIKDPGR